MSAREWGVCLGGVYPGVVCGEGVSAWGCVSASGVSAWGVCVWLWGCPGRHPLDRMADTCKTLPCHCKVFINPPVMVRPRGVNHNAFIVMARPVGGLIITIGCYDQPPVVVANPPICDGLSVL